MCGILGALGAIPAELWEAGAFVAALQRMRRRGPDGLGVARSAIHGQRLLLGMTRLAIVDRRPHPLPFQFLNGRILLAFNGEIYNWRELRLHLGDGTPWETECDAEIVAHAWRRWGSACLHHFNGMFALALVDLDRGELFLARDRAGEKPLYYATVDDTLYFASEIKAFPFPLREGPCPDLETLEFDCSEQTPFADVKSLGPGDYLRVGGDIHALKLQPWWRWQGLAETSWESPPDAAIEELTALVSDAVKIRTDGDLPVAVLISGGLDSAILQRVARSPHAYAMSFDDVDRQAAKAAACGVSLHHVAFTVEKMWDQLPFVAYHLDTPATWTACCQWAIAEQIAQDGIRIVLTGEGADELFGGYSRYRLLYWMERMRRDPGLVAYGPLRSYLIGDDETILAKLLDRGGKPETIAHARELVARHAFGPDLLACAGRLDFYTTMQAPLRMADRMTAAHSIENRAPFLDYRIMEWAARVPSSWKVTETESKAILRRVAERVGVTPEIVHEPIKRGFAIPWRQWQKQASDDASAATPRGTWNRSVFAARMRAAWRQAFGL